MMNWRAWAYDRLRQDDELLQLISLEGILGGGALRSAPAQKPFLIIGINSAIRSNVRVPVGGMVITVHDDPGDYGLIDQILARVKELFDNVAPGLPGSTVVEWLNDSQDLADDGYGTILRNSSYRLVGGQP